MIEFNEYCWFEKAEEHSQKWHDLRSKGIGGSDASSVVGMNPYKTNVRLWEEKTGIEPMEDLSDNDAVIFGSCAESPIREIYALKRKVEVEKLEGTLISKKHPFIRVNLDGYIRIDNGLLEVKTATVRKYDQLKDWDGKIPQQYYIQCLHALYVTGADYIDMIALIYLGFAKNKTAELREYRINKEDVQDDIKFLVDAEIEFWNRVETKDEPYLKIKY